MKNPTTALQYEKLYNAEQKKEFIERYTSIDSKLTIYWQFVKIAKIEFEKHKDLYEMDFQEVYELLEETKCSSINSAINHINTYKRYIEFFIHKGYTNRNVLAETEEPLSSLAKKVVADYKNVRYTREQLLHEMIDELNNYTDGALLLALFEGIKGKGFSELLTLKRSNLEQRPDGYYAHLYEEGTYKQRTIQISEELYKLLILADYQTSYRTNNKDEDVETPFNESEFIFKKAKKGKQGNSQVLDRHFITRKFLFFKKEFGNSYLTADDIVQSGMMDMAYRLYVEKGKIGKEELLEIGDQYNTLMATVDKTSYRNTTHLKRLIFTNAFKELYGDIHYTP